MNKLLIPILIATSLLSGCPDKNKSYSCVDIDSSKYIQSLTIRNGLATWGAIEYKANCGDSGNKTTYGYSQEDCITSTQASGDFLTIEFDRITGVAYSISRLGNLENSLTTLSWHCKKVD